MNSDLIKHPHKTASLLSHQYFSTLHNILDRHAPVNSKKVSLHPDKGFMNSDLLSAKRLKQKYSVYSAGTIPQLTTVDVMWLLTTTIIYLKCLNAGTVPRLLLKTMVLPRLCGTHKSSTIILPDHVSPKDLANSCGHFLSVTKLRKSEPQYNHRPQSLSPDQASTTVPYLLSSLYLRMTSSKF